MGGFASVQGMWRDGSTLKRGLMVAVPAAVLAIAATGLAVAAMSGGGGEDAQAVAPTATPETPTATPAPPTPTNEQVLAFLVAIAPTATPAPATGGGGGAPRTGGGGAPAAPRRNLTGPGPITGTDMTLAIPKIGVNATISGRTVGTNGQMGNPSGPWMVVWYDFAAWGGSLGGRPGEPGANAVFAGHVDYINVGPAVFYSVKNLAPGDLMTVYTSNGSMTYSVQWSRETSATEDFTQYVSKDGTESVTLVTCIGQFFAGQYTRRLVVRGVRVS